VKNAGWTTAYLIWLYRFRPDNLAGMFKRKLDINGKQFPHIGNCFPISVLRADYLIFFL